MSTADIKQCVRSFCFLTLFLVLAMVFGIVPATDVHASGESETASTVEIDTQNWKRNSWRTAEGQKYYVKSDGNLAVGSYEIGGTYYIFNLDGKLLCPEKAKLINVGKNTYYVSTKGTAVKGWQIIGKKLYSVKKNGVVRKSIKYQGITLTKTGAAKNNEASKVKIKTMKVVASVTKPKMTKKQKLRACWKYLVSRKKFRYVAKYPNLKKAEWQKRTAYNMLTTKSGNCYSFACAFAAMADEIGYNSYVVCGTVPGSRDGARNGYTRHAWVRINGRNYDPEAQFAGWMRGIYGEKSYRIRHKIQKIVKYDKY